MGARSGGGGAGSGGFGRGDGWFSGGVTGVESLKNIRDKGLYNATKQTISRFYKELGIPQKNVKLGNLPANVAGVHVTANGKSEGVYLNKKIFKNGTVKSVTQQMQTAYKTGFLTKTNKAVSHTLTHELAHSVWNAHMTGAKQKAAGKEVMKVYRKWKADKNKSGYGKYASTNVSEFWSETITKGMHGKADKYTNALKGIAKKYQL